MSRTLMSALIVRREKRKKKKNPSSSWLGAKSLFTDCDNSIFSEHTQDKHIQRDDEYYEGDNDNDHMDIAWSWPELCVSPL